MAYYGILAMPCKKCGGTLAMEKNEGAINGGRFVEEYNCVTCGATGYISGESSDPPNQWDKYGRAFEGSA